MKSLSVRPCSTAPRQKAAHWPASVQRVGMVKDWPESAPIDPVKASAATPIHPRKRTCLPTSIAVRPIPGRKPAGTYMRYET